MSRNICLVVAIGAILTVSAAWAASESGAPRRHRHVTHPAPPPTSERRVPAVESGSLDRFHSPSKPFAHPGDGDNDGLSRDPEDCMKGCIDGNPG